MTQLRLKVEVPHKEEDFTDTQASELLRVKVNQVRIMRERGFDTTREDALANYRISDFINVYRNFSRQSNITFKEALRNTYIKPDGVTSVFVYYPETPKDAKGPKKINQDQIKNIITLMSQNNITHIILITETQLTPDAAKSFEDLPLYRMENFLYEELTYNPTDHYMVPTHRLMTVEEAKQFLQRNGLQITDIQAISYEDPISRYYGAIPGQMFEIERENLSIDTLVDTYTSHRYVTHNGLNLPKPTARKI